MTSLPLPDDDVARAALGPHFNASTTLNGAIALAGTGGLARPAIELMEAVFASAVINARMREAIILRTAARLHCDYAIHAARRIGRNAGLSESEVAALLSDQPFTGDPDLEHAVRMADEMADDATLSDATLQGAVDRWGESDARQLILIVAWFNLVNRFENACRVPVDDAAKLASSTGPI